jgi:hypothetical protein
MRRELQNRSAGSRFIAIALALIIAPGCAQGNANTQQNSELPSVAETQANSPRDAAEPQAQTARGLSESVADQPAALDAVLLRIDSATNAQLRQGESRFADIYIANDATRSRLSSTVRQELLDWLADDENFDLQIEKRCKPDKALGFYMMAENQSEIKIVVDRGCTTLRFFDAEGKFVSARYYDPSQDLATKIFDKITF